MIDYFLSLSDTIFLKDSRNTGGSARWYFHFYLDKYPHTRRILFSHEFSLDRGSTLQRNDSLKREIETAHF